MEFFFSIFNLYMFLGTKWCGPGNIASNYHDLGWLSSTDECCRAHDHCDHIPAFSTKHGYYNYRPFTMMSCKCESEFKRCLKRVGGVSHLVRFLYWLLPMNFCYNLNWYGKVSVVKQ